MLQLYLVEGGSEMPKGLQSCNTSEHYSKIIITSFTLFDPTSLQDCGEIIGNEVFKEIRQSCAKVTYINGSTFKFYRGCIRKCPLDPTYLNKPENHCDNYKNNSNEVFALCDTDLCNKSGLTTTSLKLLGIQVMILLYIQLKAMQFNYLCFE